MSLPESTTLPRVKWLPQKLTREFYGRSARTVAIDLIGKILVLKNHSNNFRGRIVETEAYGGSDDPASHAYRGPTPRNQVMFGKPGVSYVYFTYGNHYCFNVVAESEGSAGAVLIRALEPLSGIESMQKNRSTSDFYQLTSGPGKLTQAFGISRQQNGLDLTRGDFYIIEESKPDDFTQIDVSARIGISTAKNRLLRFYEENNPHVSTFKRKVSLLRPLSHSFALRGKRQGALTMTLE